MNWTTFERALQWAGIATNYIISVALVLGGLYLVYVFTVDPLSRWFKFLRAFRVIGFAVMVGGFILAAVTYGKQIGATDCEARWKAANYEAQVQRAKQEAAAQQKAAELANKQSQQLEEQNEELQKQVNSYDEYLATVIAEQKKHPVAGCDLTPDDVRQLRIITGAGTARRKNTK